MGSIYKRTWKDKKTEQMIEGDTYWVSYYRDGKQFRESTETASLMEARQFLARKEGDIEKGIPVTPKMGRIKFSEMAADEVNDYKTNGRRSLASLERMFEKHILPFFGGVRASALTTVDIRRYIAKRLEEHGGRHGDRKASNAQINRELTAIKRAFSLAAQAGKIVSKPHIPMLKENNIRTGFFEPEPFRAVRNRLTEDVQPLVTFAYITGWRIRSEVRFLEWPQVDFEAGRVRLEPGTTKNDEGRIFPFTRELRTLLESQKAKADALKKRGIICPWVFQRNGKPIKEFRRTWKSACIAAGVPGRIPHDFRRTAVRNLVRAGIPERVAMQMTGHKTRSVFERYNIVSEGDLDMAARRLDEISSTVSCTVGSSGAQTENVAKQKPLRIQGIAESAPVAQVDRAAVS
jgi:integrase